MTAPQTVEEWITLAIEQGVVDKREDVPFIGSHGQVTNIRSTVQWLRNHCVLPYQSGFSHGYSEWPISDEQRSDAEFMQGYVAGLDDLRETQQVDKGAAAVWENLILSGRLTSVAPSQSSCSQQRSPGSTAVDWQSLARSCLQSAGLFSLLVLCFRFFFNRGVSDDGDEM